jgi:hypothetical protein
MLESMEQDAENTAVRTRGNIRWGGFINEKADGVAASGFPHTGDGRCFVQTGRRMGGTLDCGRHRRFEDDECVPQEAGLLSQAMMRAVLVIGNKP